MKATDKFIEIIKHTYINNNKFNENFYLLFGTVYIVKTQAGLKQAVKHYCSETINYETKNLSFQQLIEALKPQNKIDFNKIKFPLLIQFLPVYVGYHGTEIIIKEI